MMVENELLPRMRQDVMDIFKAGLKAVDPKLCMHRCCKREENILTVSHRSYDLNNFERIIVIGAGKAGASMACAMEEILQDRLTAGIVIVKYDHVEKLKKITLVQAGHPLPDANGVAGAEKLLALARQADEKTLIICLISGGGSALMTLPAQGLTLSDKQKTTQVLLDCGATIHEINTIRKHLSRIKGGLLAKAAYPSQMICLVLSDVVGDDLDIIASGPAVADPGTFEHCRIIIETYKIQHCLPETVVQHIKKGVQGLIPETPKKESPVFENVFHSIIAGNINALLSAQKKAKQLGYKTFLLSSMIQGETIDVAAVHTAIAKEVLATGHPVARPACILSGGETTVTIKGPGKGGRNQEFALACAIGIKDSPHVVILSAGTDGTDGPTDAAGAMADHTTVQRAEASGLWPELFLKENNAYPFFDQIFDLIKTGATNTNVMDLRLILVR
ncbi:MAG: glycerate kinase [Proteobacteria bacterium]|nr:glycerate kinase [Pseudomonadota bacterium]MBU1585467.1 glycerate kinase [Pseudomonadota bacterium]MBU2628491.1 glycerate kinase [Pseudomonadota bacterium]